MTVSPMSHRKQSKCLTLFVRSTKKPNVYSTKAKEYRQGTSSQAPISKMPAVEVIMLVPRMLLQNKSSKYCKFRGSLLYV